MTTLVQTSSTAATTTAATSSSSSSVSIDMDEFLQILVTQLQNQNPLEPTDVTEFTNQIVGYAQLGQQTEINETLGSLSSSLVPSVYSAFRMTGVKSPPTLLSSMT